MITIDEQVITYRKQLKSKLDPMRYEHSLSVSYTCMALAMRYGYDLHRAELAGLLHDCAKRYGDNELIVKCHKHNITLTEGELKAPAVIHAKYGAWMAEHKFGFRLSVAIPQVNRGWACWIKFFISPIILNPGGQRHPT